MRYCNAAKVTDSGNGGIDSEWCFLYLPFESNPSAAFRDRIAGTNLPALTFFIFTQQKYTKMTPPSDPSAAQHSLEQLQYPVGRFARPAQPITAEQRRASIHVIATFPQDVENAVGGLSDAQLDTPYRPEGWTIRQVVHHCADSHINSLVRFKLALTEDQPTVKPYEEALWAELSDSVDIPIQPSLQILNGVHIRWTKLLETMTEADFARTFLHPATGRTMRLDETLTLYDWHCRHHLAHITGLIARSGW
jgi:uncharacterized damage-inducible protein DinB